MKHFAGGDAYSFKKDSNEHGLNLLGDIVKGDMFALAFKVPIMRELGGLFNGSSEEFVVPSCVLDSYSRDLLGSPRVKRGQPAGNDRN